MSCPVLYTNTGTDAAVTFIVPRDGKIVGLKWSWYGVAVTDAAEVKCELSFGAANMYATNEANNVIGMFQKGIELTTSGAVQVDHNAMEHLPIPVPVEAGEKIYLHASFTNVTTNRLRVQLYIQDGNDNKTSSRRR